MNAATVTAPVTFLEAPPKKLNPDVGFFRFRRFGGDVLMTNDYGDWLFVTNEEFDRLTRRRLPDGDPLRQRLADKNMLNDKATIAKVIAKLRQRTAFMNGGPNLHILIVTLRCNYTCSYCHASSLPMDTPAVDMSTETARKVVDTAFMTTSPSINFEFQGGEPLANFETIKFVINYAREKNRVEKKDLAFSLVSNLSLLRDEHLDVLIAPDIYICTSLDGPREVQQKNRIFVKGSSYDQTIAGMDKINAAYIKAGMDPHLYHVDALLTTTRHTIKAGAKAVVDEYVKRGLKTIHVRPLNPYGFVDKTWKAIGYSIEQFNAFYNECLDYIIELNKNGTEIIERGAALALQKILTDDDPNYMELRSPCGAAIGQIAYNHDGRVTTCDEGRMLLQTGDDAFVIGDVHKNGYHEMMDNEIVRSMAVASTQDAVPYCHECSYKPYCGVCPIHNYKEHGSIVGSMTPQSSWCKRAMFGFDTLFGHLKKSDPAVDAIFSRWITRRFRAEATDCNDMV